MTITTINPSICRLLRSKLETALSEFADETGVNVKVGSASYTADYVDFKVNVAIKGVDREKKDFEHYAPFFGLKHSHYQTVFTTGRGDRFKLIGLKPRAPKFPVLGRRVSDGEVFKFRRNVLDQILRDAPHA